MAALPVAELRDRFPGDDAADRGCSLERDLCQSALTGVPASAPVAAMHRTLSGFQPTFFAICSSVAIVVA
jgi:hypothetical protein